MKAKLIGVCGRSGAGKTTVCSEFIKYGAAFIDTDAVYRELTAPICGEASPLVKRISDEFGDVVLADGSLDRKKLASIVFSDRERLEALNTITHKTIMDETMKRAEEYSEKGAVIVLIDAPALFESGGDKMCDKLLSISAPDDVLIKRICARDGIEETAAVMRLNSQPSDEELRMRCDYVIYNYGKYSVNEQVAEIVREITEGDCDEIEKK